MRLKYIYVAISIIATGILGLLFLAPAAQAASYYVDQNSTQGACDDNYTIAENNITHPWCTIGAANTKHAAGDAVNIMPGVYRESILPKSGIDDATHTVYTGLGTRADIIIDGSDIVTGWTKCTDGDSNCTGVSTSVYYASFVVANPTRGECYTTAGGPPPCSPYTQDGSSYRCFSGDNPTSHGTDCWQDGTNWFARADLNVSRFDASKNETDISGPGQYYYHYDLNTPANSKVYIWPFSDVDPNTHTIECSVRQLHGPTIYSPANYHLQDITINNLKLIHSVDTSIFLFSLSRDYDIINNEFAFDSGGGTCANNPSAIYHAADAPNTYPHINVTNNIFHHLGSDKGLSVNFPSQGHIGTAVQFYSTTDSIIADNTIYEVAQPIAPKMYCDNITIRNNVISRYFTAIDLMNNVHDVTIEGNVFYDSYRNTPQAPLDVFGALTWRGGNYNTNNYTIRNNTFDDVEFGVVMDKDSLPASFGHIMSNNLFSNVDYAMITRYTTPPSYLSSYNFYFTGSGNQQFATGDPNSGGLTLFNLSEWQTYTGQEDHAIQASSSGPQIFVNAAANDYHLADTSPAIDAGTYVNGYHCSAPDENGGDVMTDCRHWNGAAPDAGAYEHAAITSCTESWTCGSWSTCSNGTQTRACTDAHSCGTTVNRPALTQSCQVCTESWTCGAWSTCSNSIQTRTCTDANACGTTNDKPAVSQSCQAAPACVESWTCGAWSTCTNSIQTRTCTDANACGTVINKPAESASCSSGETTTPDTITPNTQITSSPVGTTTSRTATFQWTGTDDTTAVADLTYAYQFDGGTWSDWASTTTLTLTRLRNGTHTLSVRARDSAGNIDDTPASVMFTLSRTPLIVTGANAGGGPQVRVFTPTGRVISQFFAYEKTFHGGVTVAMGDLGMDGIDEIVVGPGRGRQPQVKIFRQNGSLVASFLAYDKRFRGGVRVAIGDVDGDGINEIITSAGPGGGPQIRVFKQYNSSWRPLAGASTMAYDKRFRGGVFVTALDINGDGIDEIATAPGAGGSPQIRVFALQSNRLVAIRSNLMAYAAKFRGGVTVAGGNVNANASEELLTGVYGQGGPQVRTFGQTASGINLVSSGFMAFDPKFRGGVTVAAGDTTGDGIDEIITAVNSKGRPWIRIFSAAGKLLRQFYAYAPSFKGGMTVAVGE